MERIIGSALDLSHWTSTHLKYGLKTLFLLFKILEIENVLGVLSPVPSTSLFLHNTEHMKMAWFVKGGGGGEAVKMFKQFSIKAH